MITVVVAVRDAKTEVFSQPMFFITKGVALRSFFDEAERQGSNINAHPEDFALFHLGGFDDQSGAFIPLKQPEQIAVAFDGKKQ